MSRVLDLLEPAHGQCRLSVVSTTQLKLSPYNGRLLNINGLPVAIPSAGVTVSNAGLAVSTLYYVYAYLSAGSVALELSTTGHTTHTNGVEIKTGDSSRTLVGMIFTSGTSTFVDSGEVRTLANWFNRRDIFANTGTISDGTTSTAAFEELTGGRSYLLSWAGEPIEIEIVGAVRNNTAGNIAHITSAGIDGATSGAQTTCTTFAANIDCPAYARGIVHPAEGFHYLQAFGKVSAGTGTWTFGTQAKTRA